MKRLFGVGVNDLKMTDKPRLKEIRNLWRDMLRRCYSPKRLAMYPTYVGTEVCDDWKLLSNFYNWAILQDREGKALDKDLLGDSKLYSPDTCIFIPRQINSFMNINQRRRNGLIGTTYIHGSWYSNVSDPRVGKIIRLGRFGTELEAHQTWHKAKYEIAQYLVETYPEIGERAAKALLDRFSLEKDLTGV